MNLSPHFTLAELTQSEYAARMGLLNEPGQDEIANLKRMAALLELVRAKVGNPIIVSSGYRSPAVNAGIGGSKTSQHMFGCAADIRALGMPVNALMKTICDSDIQYDQLILEFGSWVHISVPNKPESKPRRQSLIIDKTGTRAYR